MTRPRSCTTAVLAASLVLSLGVAARPTRASTISSTAATSTVLANYRLTASDGLPVPSADISGPQVVAMVVPSGGVVPPTNADGTQGSPLTVLSDSTGFDAGQLVVALKDATAADGTPEQLLGLVFFGNGLQAGGQLHFSLSIDKSLASNPPQLVSTTPGVSIIAEQILGTDPGDGSGTGGPTPPTDGDGTVNVPEPVAFVVWSALAGAIALRARAVQRARMAPPAA